ncbi:MAG: cytochrome P450 [Enhygromyxa sp.]
MIQEPIAALKDWRARYGPTFLLNQLGTRVVVTADPELVREIYEAEDPELYAAVLPPALEVLFGAHSLLMDAGAAHRRKRKLMMPPFHGARMREWGETIVATGRRNFAVEGEVRALDLAQRTTLELIVRIVFGVDEASRVAEFVAAVLAWTSAVRPGFLFVRALQRELFGISPFARYWRAWQRVDALLLEQITQTRASPGGRGDVLAALVAARYDDGEAMSDQSIRDQLRTLLYAGYETSAIVLTWALYFVLREPEIRERLLAELGTLEPDADAEAIARLPYLGAVIDETLRMRPVTPDPVRVLSKPASFGEWRLPAGMAIAPAPTLLHHDPQLWPEPERFSPERFYGGRPSPYVYIPFGGGSRRCLGATFARFEAAILLAILLREFEIELLDKKVEWGRGLATLQPLGGVRMRVRKK